MALSYGEVMPDKVRPENPFFGAVLILYENGNVIFTQRMRSVSWVYIGSYVEKTKTANKQEKN